MSAGKYTSGPWAVDRVREDQVYIVAASGGAIARVMHGRPDGPNNAERIVQCVNAHDELVRHLHNITTLSRHQAADGFLGARKRMPPALASAIADAEVFIAKATGAAA